MSQPGPEQCAKCGHKLPAGAPEPCWCPECGKLCSAFDVDPSIETIPCPKCWRRTPAGDWTVFHCQGCGHRWRLTPAESEEESDRRRRRRRWAFCFWLLFLMGPVLAMCSVMVSQMAAPWIPAWLLQHVRSVFAFRNFMGFSGALIAPLVLTSVAAAYCLVRYHDKDQSTLRRLSATVLFAFGIMIVYVGVAFGGCALAMGRWGG